MRQIETGVCNDDMGIFFFLNKMFVYNNNRGFYTQEELNLMHALERQVILYMCV